MDKRYDAKLFAKTKLLLIDVQETLGKYRQIFNEISVNKDMDAVLKLQKKLSALKNEEAVPEELQSDLILAQMRLDEGSKALKFYEDRTESIAQDIENQRSSPDAYKALKICREANMLLSSTPANGMYSYNPEQVKELQDYISMCHGLAQRAFDDGWIKRQNCNGIENLSSYRGFIKKVAEVFETFQYNNEANLLRKQKDAEVERINLLIKQQSLLTDCDAYLESSKVERGLTMRNLEALYERGNTLLTVFNSFDYNIDKRFKNAYQDMFIRIDDIKKEMAALKSELTKTMDAIYDITTVDDARRVSQQISAILTRGISEKDREDFEYFDALIRQFIQDIQGLHSCEDSQKAIDSIYQKLKEKYNEDSEFDLSVALDNTYNDRIKYIRDLEMTWKDKYLTINPEKMSQFDLDQWKRDALPWPLYLSEETVKSAETMYEQVEQMLSKQRLEYILKLINDLSEDEKQHLIQLIR